MQGPTNGINPKPPGTQNGPAPKSKGLKPNVGQPGGFSLPPGPQPKVPAPGAGSVQGTF